MTLSDLETSARAVKLGASSGYVLADDVLAYAKRVRDAGLSLTPRQAELVGHLRTFRHEHGYSPSLQELADAMGVSKVTVFEFVKALKAKGVVRQDAEHKWRNLYVVGDEVK